MIDIEEKTVEITLKGYEWEFLSTIEDNFEDAIRRIMSEYASQCINKGVNNL